MYGPVSVGPSEKEIAGTTMVCIYSLIRLSIHLPIHLSDFLLSLVLVLLLESGNLYWSEFRALRPLVSLSSLVDILNVFNILYIIIILLPTINVISQCSSSSFACIIYDKSYIIIIIIGIRIITYRMRMKIYLQQLAS